MDKPAKKIRLLSVKPAGTEAVVLTFESSDGEIAFVGGQYIIINSGIEISEDKYAKRAYTIVSPDRDTKNLSLLVYNKGTVSGRLTAAEPGEEFEYSGPWGKAVADPGWPFQGRVLLAGTHSGISAVCSLLHSKKMEGRDIEACWFTDRTEESGQILAALGLADGQVKVSGINGAEILDCADNRRPASAFLAGEESAINSIKNRLTAAGVSGDSIIMEKYFTAAEIRLQGEPV